jgi:amidase
MVYTRRARDYVDVGCRAAQEACHCRMEFVRHHSGLLQKGRCGASIGMIGLNMGSILRSAYSSGQTNCLSEILFDSALATARSLDDYLKQTGKLKGPFHGLPISIKDNFNIIGTDTTVGFVSFVNDPAKYNSTLVEMLNDAGAVLYVKTNVPTAMMIAETVNNVLGRTVNPLNRMLTSGGSSGGESALIAFGGSPLGVGTDIGM